MSLAHCPGTFCLLATAGWLLAGTSLAQDRPSHQPPGEINATFTNPELDAGRYVDRFENESREVYAHREAIAATLGLAPGQAVADIGAGTGLFSLLFAEQVKPEGKVYAVEIAPAFLKLIAERAAQRGLDRVVSPVRGGQDTTNLPAGSIDVAFICDTYHHFEHPAEVLGSIRRALRPGGRLVLVEFDRQRARGDFVKNHVRADKEVFLREIRDAGFEPIRLEGVPALRDNFIAGFRKPARDGSNGPNPADVTPGDNGGPR